MIEGMSNQAFIESMMEWTYQTSNGSCYMPVGMKAYWRCIYARQGKRYPSPHKRKSKVWRDRMIRKMRLI